MPKQADPFDRDRPTGDETISADEREDAIALIAQTAGMLARLARDHDLEMLNYLLRMAHLEAEDHLRLRSQRNLC